MCTFFYVFHWRVYTGQKEQRDDLANIHHYQVIMAKKSLSQPCTTVHGRLPPIEEANVEIVSFIYTKYHAQTIY